MVAADLATLVAAQQAQLEILRRQFLQTRSDLGRGYALLESKHQTLWDCLDEVGLLLRRAAQVHGGGNHTRSTQSGPVESVQSSLEIVLPNLSGITNHRCSINGGGSHASERLTQSSSGLLARVLEDLWMSSSSKALSQALDAGGLAAFGCLNSRFKDTAKAALRESALCAEVLQPDARHPALSSVVIQPDATNPALSSAVLQPDATTGALPQVAEDAGAQPAQPGAGAVEPAQDAQPGTGAMDPVQDPGNWGLGVSLSELTNAHPARHGSPAKQRVEDPDNRGFAVEPAKSTNAHPARPGTHATQLVEEDPDKRGFAVEPAKATNAHPARPGTYATQLVEEESRHDPDKRGFAVDSTKSTNAHPARPGTYATQLVEDPNNRGFTVEPAKSTNAHPARPGRGFNSLATQLVEEDPMVEPVQPVLCTVEDAVAAVEAAAAEVSDARHVVPERAARSHNTTASNLSIMYTAARHHSLADKDSNESRMRRTSVPPVTTKGGKDDVVVGSESWMRKASVPPVTTKSGKEDVVGGSESWMRKASAPPVATKSGKEDVVGGGSESRMRKASGPPAATKSGKEDLVVGNENQVKKVLYIDPLPVKASEGAVVASSLSNEHQARRHISSTSAGALPPTPRGSTEDAAPGGSHDRSSGSRVRKASVSPVARRSGKEDLVAGAEALTREASAAEEAAKGSADAVPDGVDGNPILLSDHQPQQWEVVVASVVVRTRCALDSPYYNGSPESSRLSCGVVVEQLDLSGTRLHYRLVKGEGPPQGWVSISTSNNRLLTKIPMPKGKLPQTFWTYWDQGADSLPHFHFLCIESWRVVHPNWHIEIVDKENIHEFVRKGDLPHNFNSLKKPQHRSDCARLAIMKRHGGVYLDPTVLIWKDIAKVVDWASMEQGRYDFVGFCRGTRKFAANWLMACRAGCLLIDKWHREHLRYWERPATGAASAVKNFKEDPFFEGVTFNEFEPDELTYLVQHAVFKKLHDLDTPFKRTVFSANTKFMDCLEPSTGGICVNRQIQSLAHDRATDFSKGLAMRYGLSDETSDSIAELLLWEDSDVVLHLVDRVPFAKFTSVVSELLSRCARSDLLEWRNTIGCMLRKATVGSKETRARRIDYTGS